MTRPFQYDNFVKSQIAGDPGNGQAYYTESVRGNQRDNQLGSYSRASLKNKINELLGLCKDENEGIKAHYQQVLGAQRQILDLMKQQLQQPPRFTNYAKSNVEMFAPPLQGGFSQSNLGYPGQDADPRSRPNTTYPHIRNEQFNYQGGQAYEPQQVRAQGSYPVRQPYVSDYTSGGQAGSGPYLQSGYNQAGYYQGYPGDEFIQDNLRSKVLELQQENNKLKGISSQPQRQQRQDQDPEVRQLQQEVNRLRGIVQQYENELASINNNPAMSDRAALLQQLKDQGERIRQDTLALLRGRISSQQYGQYTEAPRQYADYSQGARQYTESPAPQQQYAGTPRMDGLQELSGSVQRGLTGDQQARFRAQLYELRSECEQLKSENASIKRQSKGTTGASRRY